MPLAIEALARVCHSGADTLVLVYIIVGDGKRFPPIPLPLSLAAPELLFLGRSVRGHHRRSGADARGIDM